MSAQPTNEIKPRMRNTARWTSIAVRAALLLTLAVGTALIANRLSPVGIPLVGQWDPLEGLVHAVPQNDGFNDRIEIDTIETAKSIYDDTETLFVDARSAKDYEAGHVKGAVSLPLHDFDAGIQAFLERYPPEQPIVTYCSGISCDDSHHLAGLLHDLGYERVGIMIDGFRIWQERGYPVD